MFKSYNTKIKKNYRGFIIIIIIVIIIIFFYYYKYGIIYRLFFSQIKNEYYNYFNSKPHSGKDTLDLKYKLDKRLETEHNSYSILSYMYIIDWKYKYFQMKNILDRGGKSLSIYLDKEVNNLVFNIGTHKDIQKVRIFNVNINKWFHFGIVVQNLQLDLYYNGKLYSSHVLNDFPNKSNDNLIICKNEGFSGLLYDMYLYDKALTYLQIDKLSRRTPPVSEKYFKDKY